MSAALGGASPQASAAPTQASAPPYSQAPAPYQMGTLPGQIPAQVPAQMPGQMYSQAAAPLGGGGGSMRLFSSRNAGGVPQAMPQQGFAPPMASGGGMRLFSSRRSMMAAAPAALPQAVAPASQPVYAPPAANPNTWSLANQGAGQFSSDTAQFDSQFGAPLPTASFGNQTQPGMNAAAYPITTPGGTRLKVVTGK